MECTKSNEASHLGEKKKKRPHLLEVLLDDVNWKNLTMNERIICIYFALSFCSVICLCHTWLVIPAIVCLIVSASNIVNVRVKE